MAKRIYWTKEKCQEEALKYQSRTTFQKGSSSAYKSARINNWLDEICSHMEELKKPSGYWTLDRCQEEALKYKTRTAFQKGSNTAYLICLTNKWLDAMCFHMKFKFKTEYTNCK